MKLYENERIDEIGFGNLKLIQNPKEFCYGVDAVLLADFAAKIAKKTDVVFDLGTGTGVIPMILNHKRQCKKLYGVEIQEDSAKRANRSLELNSLQGKIEIINNNILEVSDEYFGMVDVVLSNPPYYAKGNHLINDSSAKTIARHEIAADLSEFFKVASKLLKDKGEMFMVHRPSRLADLMCYSRAVKLEPKTIQMVAPKEGSAPNIVLIHFVKNSGKEIKMLSNLNVHRLEGGYTEEILQIYEK